MSSLSDALSFRKHTNKSICRFSKISDSIIEISLNAKNSKPCISLTKPMFTDSFYYINILSNDGFDNFFNIFPLAEKIDIKTLQLEFNDINFLMAYGFHEQFTGNFDDLKFKYSHNTHNKKYDFLKSFNIKGKKIRYEVSIIYNYDIKNDKLIMSKNYVYENSYISKYSSSSKCYDVIRNGITDYFVDILNISNLNLKLEDHKILPMLII